MKMPTSDNLSVPGNAVTGFDEIFVQQQGRSA
jgi:hypothetical protein